MLCSCGAGDGDGSEAGAIFCVASASAMATRARPCPRNHHCRRPQGAMSPYQRPRPSFVTPTSPTRACRGLTAMRSSYSSTSSRTSSRDLQSWSNEEDACWRVKLVGAVASRLLQCSSMYEFDRRVLEGYQRVLEGYRRALEGYRRVLDGYLVFHIFRKSIEQDDKLSTLRANVCRVCRA